MVAQSEQADKGLLDYVNAIWRHKYVVILTAIVAVGATLGIDASRSKHYTSTAQVLLAQPGSAASNATGSNANTEPNVPTDIQLIQSAQVRHLVTHHLGSAPAVAVSQVGTTNVVDISATTSHPTTSAKLANTYATSYLAAAKGNYIHSINGQMLALQLSINNLQKSISQINAQLAQGSSGSGVSNLESQLTSLLGEQQTAKAQLTVLQQNAASASGGQIISPAVPDSTPSSPKPLEDALYALGIGLLLGIGLALLRDYFDDRIRSKEQLEQATGNLPILGLIPDVSDWRDRRSPLLVELARPRSPAAEAYRSLRTSVQFLGLERPIQLLQLTSAVAEEGKTTTSANLAVAMAEAGTRVVLVSCDLRKPRVHEFFGLPNAVGLTSVFAGDADLPAAIQQTPSVPDLSVLTSGPIPPNPSELLAGPRAVETFNLLKHEYDIVLLDSSPLLPVSDGSVLAGLADAVLLITASDVSTRRQISRALELLGQVSANVIGTILNRASVSDSYIYSRYGYGYGYGTAQISEVSTELGAPAPSIETNGRDMTARAPRHAR